MRSLFPVLALPLIVPAASTAQPPASANPEIAFRAGTAPALRTGGMLVVNPLVQDPLLCPPTSRYEASKRDGKLEAQKLNDLPMADGYKAVLRQVGGCNVPVMVGYGFGREQR